MSELDIAKALTQVDDSKFARVSYGVAQSASKDGYVSVLLDGHTSPNTLKCDCFIDSGYRVKVVGDPSGRYLVYSMESQILALESDISSASTKVKQVRKTDGTAFPMLLKNTANTTDEITDQVGYGSSIVANPGESSIKARNYYGTTDNDSTPFHGDLDGNADTASKWTDGLSLSLTGVVSGDSEYFNGSETGVNRSHSNWNPKLSTSINCGTGLTVSNGQLTNTGVTSINVSGSLSITGNTGSVTITGTDTNTTYTGGTNITINGTTINCDLTVSDDWTNGTEGKNVVASQYALYRVWSGLSSWITDVSSVAGDNATHITELSDTVTSNSSAISSLQTSVNNNAGNITQLESAVSKCLKSVWLENTSDGNYAIQLAQNTGTTSSTRSIAGEIRRIGPFDGINEGQVYSTGKMDINPEEYRITLKSNTNIDAACLTAIHLNEISASKGVLLANSTDDYSDFVGLGARATSGNWIFKLWYQHHDRGSYSGDTIYIDCTTNFHGNTITYSVLNGVNVLREDSEAQTLSTKEGAEVAYTPGTSAKLKFVAPLKIEDGAITEWSDVELTFRDGVLTDLKYPDDYMQEV